MRGQDWGHTWRVGEYFCKGDSQNKRIPYPSWLSLKYLPRLGSSMASWPGPPTWGQVTETFWTNVSWPFHFLKWLLPPKSPGPTLWHLCFFAPCQKEEGRYAEPADRPSVCRACWPFHSLLNRAFTARLPPAGWCFTVFLRSSLEDEQSSPKFMKLKKKTL